MRPIASAYGLATLIAATALLRMGQLVDCFGTRAMLIFVACGLGVSCLLFGVATGVTTLALDFALLRFVGQGSLMMSSVNLVAQ